MKRSAALAPAAYPFRSNAPGLKATKPLRSKPQPKANEDQLARWERMRAIGCIACLQNVRFGLAPAPLNFDNRLEIQHHLSGRRRRGHDDTVCLCTLHHQGNRLPDPSMGYKAHARLYGPSFGKEPSRFREMYGNEDAQLAYQERLLAGESVTHA